MQNQNNNNQKLYLYVFLITNNMKSMHYKGYATTTKQVASLQQRLVPVATS